MSAADAWVFEPDGFDPRRAVQIVTQRDAGAGRRGSGYRVTGDVVLTAAHVISDATSVQIRFLAEDGSTTDLPGERVWADSDADIALLTIAGDPSAGGPFAAEVSPVRFARIMQPVDCEALGFPRFMLRADSASSYRDSHHAIGRTTPLTGRREGSLTISVNPPEYDPEKNRSPWEGMSGAAVWSGGSVIGVVSKHHRAEGLGTLAASRVDRWYQLLTPARLNELHKLIGLPTHADQLQQLPRAPWRSDGAPELREKTERLAEEVKKQWHREELRRRVHDPFPLPVRFRNAPTEGFDHWRSIVKTPDPRPLALAGHIDRIVQVYRSIRSRRLVVLGQAGSGKTILALRFVLDWLSSRAPDDPVPVIFSLSSWDPTTTSLRDWMCGQLERDYLWLAAPVEGGGSLAGALVDAERILPVLDGFDEIASGLQGAALSALNVTDRALLLTSRPKEYAMAVKEKVLSAAAGIELEDLTLDDLTDYLSYAGRPGANVWEPVLAQLREQQPSEGVLNVTAVLATPLMVALARTVYSGIPGHDPQKLLDTDEFATPKDIEEHLLAAFVPAAYCQPPADSDSHRGTGRRRHWDPDRAEYWLGYLAQHLVQRRTSDLAWWELGTTLSRSLRTLLVGFLAALAFGITTGIGNVPVDLVVTSRSLTFILVRGLVVGLLHGLAIGLLFGLVYRFVSERAAFKPSPVQIQLHGWIREIRRTFRSKIRPRFLVGFGLGTPGALSLVLLDRYVVDPLGLYDGQGGGLGTTIMFVLGIGFGIGLILVLIALLETPVKPESAVNPAALLATDRRNVVFHLIVWALVPGLGSGFFEGLARGPLRGLEVGTVFGLEAAFGAGLGYGLSLTAWGQWVALARMWLPLRGLLPWALIAFLDDAHRRGVLRQDGAVYQFRHARVQAHLSRTFQERAARRAPEETHESSVDANDGRTAEQPMEGDS